MAGTGCTDGHRPNTEHDQPQHGVLPIAEWTPANIAEPVFLPSSAVTGGLEPSGPLIIGSESQ